MLASCGGAYLAYSFHPSPDKLIREGKRVARAPRAPRAPRSEKEGCKKQHSTEKRKRREQVAGYRTKYGELTPRFFLRRLRWYQVPDLARTCWPQAWRASAHRQERQGIKLQNSSPDSCSPLLPTSRSSLHLPLSSAAPHNPFPSLDRPRAERAPLRPPSCIRTVQVYEYASLVAPPPSQSYRDRFGRCSYRSRRVATTTTTATTATEGACFRPPIILTPPPPPPPRLGRVRLGLDASRHATTIVTDFVLRRVRRR